MGRTWLYAVLLLIFSVPAFGQKAGRISFAQAIELLEDQHQFQFSYSYSLVRDVMVDRPAADHSLAESLSYLREQLPFLKFDTTSPKNILVLVPGLPLRIKVLDATDGSTTNSFYIKYGQSEGQMVYQTEESRFELTNFSLSDTIRVFHPYYEAFHIEAPALLMNPDILLKPLIVALGEVEISSYLASGISSNLLDHSLIADLSQMSLLAGETEGDVFQLLKALPGIQSPNGKPGSFNLRGNLFGQNLIYLDDILIYHTGHFFGTFSPYNPHIVSDIKVIRSTLPANWGGRVGGLVDIRTDNALTDSISARAFVNTVFGGLNFKTPIIKGKLGLSFAMRNDLGVMSPKLEEYSILNFQGSAFDYRGLNQDRFLDREEVHFNDINAKLQYRINAAQELNISFLSISNSTDHNLISNQQDLQRSANTSLRNWGASARWKAQLKKRLELHSSISTSRLAIREVQTDSTISQGQENRYDQVRNNVSDLRFNTSLVYKHSPKTNISGGYEAQYHELRFQSEVREPINMNPDRDDLSQATIHSVYLDLIQRLNSKWLLKPGVRSDYYSLTGQWYGDLRIFTSYQASANWNFKASAGRVHQYIMQLLGDDFNDFRTTNQFWTLADGQRFPVMKSYKAMLGFVMTPSFLLVDIELYQQYTQDVSKQPRPRSEPEVGDVNTLGVDVLIRAKWSFMESWITYTLTSTRLDFGDISRAYFDQNHIFSINSQVPLGRFKVAASWGYMSGLPVDPNLNAPAQYSGEFPAQHQLDLSATYTFLQARQGSRWKGVLGISLINVYNQELVVNQFYVDPQALGHLRMGLGFTPGAQLSISW